MDAHLSDEISRLTEIVSQTAADLHKTRRIASVYGGAAGNPAYFESGPRSLGGASVSNQGGLSLSMEGRVESNALSLRNLRRDIDARSQRMAEMMTMIESDVKSFRKQYGEAADNSARIAARVDRMMQTLGVIESRQGDIWQAVQQRPTRGEVDTTISASVMPGEAYTKTRIESLSKTVSEMQASAVAAQGGEDVPSQSRRGGGASLDYLEERLEKRLEDFLERKMRIRSRQLEADVVMALKSNKDLRKAWGVDASSPREVGIDGSGKEDSHRSEEEEDKLHGAGDENEGAAANNGEGSAQSANEKYVTKQDLDLVQQKFSKEVRLVQNSLVSLRTQVRALGRDLKEMTALSRG